MKILTKVAKGVAFGDVSNQSVRNLLTEISKAIGGKFTEQEMYDTLDYFDWKCPYTNKDLRPLIEGNLGGYATDHIYPQNKEWCGLNVKGNLIIVDREANNKKHNQDVETFLLKDQDVLGNLDEKTRQQRLEKIKEFQKLCGYDPQKIRSIVSPLMQARYDEIRRQQETCINEALTKLETINIHSVSIKNTSVVKPKPKSSKNTPDIIFHPADVAQFKSELLKRKRARFVLTYDSGAIKTTLWKAESFDINSNLKANIQSRPFWRKKVQEGLVCVEVHID